jgi:NAD(P)-dependent dehydrogenase (short-subunit alcohol dehydrogenase family)
MTLQGKIALITGAGSGMGRAIAQAYSTVGATVGLVDLHGDAAKETLASCVGHGISIGADVSDPEAIAAALAAVRAELGPVDVLVNNAGISGAGAPRPAHETDRAEWERVLAVNLIAPAMICNALIPEMVQRGSGVIVNMASTVGLVAFPGRTPYTASKGGLISLTRTIAAEYATQGIRANALCPGWVETSMTEDRLSQAGAQEVVRAVVPMGRVAEPSELADAAVFLGSDASRYMTGQVLVVDGGYTAI